MTFKPADFVFRVDPYQATLGVGHGKTSRPWGEYSDPVLPTREFSLAKASSLGGLSMRLEAALLLRIVHENRT